MKDERNPRDPRFNVGGGYRCTIEQSEWLPSYWVGYSPRNGQGACVEGPWCDWVALARNILRAHAEAVAGGFCEDVPE